METEMVAGGIEWGQLFLAFGIATGLIGLLVEATQIGEIIDGMRTPKNNFQKTIVNMLTHDK